MSAERVFIDTSVLTALFDDAEPEKQARARACLTQEGRELFVSTQVLQELYVSLTTGSEPIASPETAEAAVRAAQGYSVVQVDTPLVLAAITSSRTNQLPFWDALIVCAAASSGCRSLLSEDLNHGQVIEGVKVDNPFRA